MGPNKNTDRFQLSKYFLNQAGVSLMETVVAAAILGVIAVAVMKVNEQSNRASAKQETKSDLTTMTNEINTLLSDPKKCKETFRSTDGLTPKSIVAKIEKDGDGKEVESGTSTPTDKRWNVAGRKFYIATESEGEDGYGAAKVRFESFSLPTDDTDILKVTFRNKQALKNSALGGKSLDGTTISREIPLYVEWDKSAATWEVKECRSLMSTSTLIWTRGSGTNIYYSGGNVGINEDNPPADYALSVRGKVFVTDEITAKSFMYSSDARLKKNTKLITNPIEKLMSLRGVGFDWKKSDQSDFGFIAQEVQKTIPEIVKSTTTDEKILTVDYVKILPFLLEGIKQQQKEIEDLERKLHQIQSEGK